MASANDEGDIEMDSNSISALDIDKSDEEVVADNKSEKATEKPELTTVPDHQSASAILKNTQVKVVKDLKDICPTRIQFTFFLKKSKTSNKVVFVCSLCEEEFPDKETAFPHMHKHTVVCEYCSMRFATRKHLWSHIRSKNHIAKEVEQHLCDHCGDVFKSKQGLELHVRTLHRSGDKLLPFTCKKCNKKFPDWDSMRSHLVEHSQNIKCSDCEEAFSNKATLWIHYYITHLDDKRPFLCQTCGAAFKEENALNVHELRHMKVRLFECSLCSKSFVRESNLKLHVEKIHSYKKHICEYCGKEFNKLVSYNYHLTHVHVNNGKHVCGVCGKPFETRDSLVAHKSTHQDVVHQCRFCKKLCSNRYNLKAHEGTHTSESARYPCKFCPMRFYKKLTLNLHVEEKHEVETAESN